MECPEKSCSEKEKARQDAEKQVALYKKKSTLYLKKGTFRVDDEIDVMRGRVAEVIYHAVQTGAEVSDLIDTWMSIASKIINAKKKSR
ncbi:hypothetical protein GF369_02920 [Candidatus Peregrinibacteria bacterium]|nr:hypothetical protein [Candidatus Peregrinibacteria bacterium]